MRTRLLAALAAGLVAAAPALAAGLGDLLPLARENDADYRGARAARDVALTGRVLGIAQLRPTIAAAYELGNSDLQRNYANGAAPLRFSANSKTTSLSLTQPVIDLQKWNSYKEEDARAAYAELHFVEASVEIMVRLSRTYFDALLAEDSLTVSIAQKEALSAQRLDAENLFKGGMATITDIEETRARELQAEAGVNEARYARELRRNDLKRIVGDLPPDGLHPIGRIETALPDPDRLQTWLDATLEANPKILSAQKTVEQTGFGAERARAAQYPSLDLIASASRTRDPNSFTQLEDNSGVTLRLSIPLYQGGRLDAMVDRAVATRAQAQAELEGARREAVSKASEAFLGVGNSVAKIRALEQSLRSAETTLDGLRIGRKVGIRTNTDVLNGLTQLFTVRRDLQKERYNYLLSRIQLKAAAGRLTDDDLLAVDRIAKESKPDPTPPPPPATPMLKSNLAVPPLVAEREQPRAQSR